VFKFEIQVEVEEHDCMTISSRTPEGDPNRCPICGNRVQIESSKPFGDAPCPSCGHLLWFFGSDFTRHVFDRASAQSIHDQFIDWLVAEKKTTPAIACLAISGNRIALEQLGLDSLETIEIMTEFEEVIKR
jgi:acyl carrier protein